MTFDARLLSGIGVLLAVVEAGSFARAGEAMGLTQPAVSRAVARLEERVGIRIFNRSARAISLTDEGRRFYELVAPLLSAIEEAAIMAGGTKTHVRGKLRINVDGTFGHFVLAPRINDFLERYPELSVEIFVRDSIGDFVGEGTDVAVRFGEPGAYSMHTELLLETRVFTCASAQYLKKYGRPQVPGDLLHGHQCVLIRDPATGRPFAWEFQSRGEAIPFAATGRVMVNDTGSLIAACRSGAGIAQLLELYVRNELSDGDLIQILPDWSEETFPLHAYYRRSDLMPAKLCAFLDFVREIVA
ncbi:LysR family transcriptional regulator [Ensifer sp. ENS06]|uniref:LysR family transcriptional regulator n=1 Tax=Ensifer sp. ENS06 TaxID=2769276 RepID=UPI000DDF7651|nr:LysR family transcriptional regulator [Ensifer sp. ENS06]MBD9625077.1 LysR family transcriptional regulator [Ensifer sp. ENS06]